MRGIRDQLQLGISGSGMLNSAPVGMMAAFSGSHRILYVASKCDWLVEVIIDADIATRDIRTLSFARADSPSLVGVLGKQLSRCV